MFMDGKKLVDFDPFAEDQDLGESDLDAIRRALAERVQKDNPISAIRPISTWVVIDHGPRSSVSRNLSYYEVAKWIERNAAEEIEGFVYTGETEAGPELVEALDEMLHAFGFEESEREEPRYGSYFQRLTAWMKVKAASPAGVDAREKAQRALELKVLDKEQAEVDAQQAEAVARVITALEKTERCALLVGSLLVVKLPELTVARNLTQRQLLHLNANPELQMQPEKLLELLAASETQDRRPAKSRSELEAYLLLALEERAG